MYYDTDSGILRFSPSDLTIFMETEFGSWMDRWQAERWNGNREVAGENGLPIAFELPGVDECEPDKKDEHLELIAAKGMEHERAFLEQLRHEGHEIAELDAGSASLADTIEAMQQRKDFIFQARLEHGIFGGFADFLVRTAGPSVLGDHHYEVWDTKLARTPRASFVIQLCAYSDMLEHIQGRRPKGFEVVLGTNERVRFLTNRFIYYYRALKHSFLEFHNQYDSGNFPHPGLSKSFGRWNTFAEQVLESSDHLSRVANISRGQIKKLEAVGIATMTDLAVSTIDRVPQILQPVLQRLRTQARLQLESRDKERPQFQIQPSDEHSARRGLALLPRETHVTSMVCLRLTWHEWSERWIRCRKTSSRSKKFMERMS